MSSPTKPIPIDAHRRRAPSDSDSSDGSECSPTTPYSTNAPFPTPATGYTPRIAPVSPSTSPIFSYFLSQGPSKSPTSSLPFRRNFGPPAIDEDDETPMPPGTKHARRASTAWTAGSERFTQTAAAPTTATPQQHERATGVLRRLSLGGAMARPQIPQFNKNAVAGEEIKRRMTPPTLPPTPTPRKSRRSNTMAAGTQRPKRAPSPMGERILTGHFDSFH